MFNRISGAILVVVIVNAFPLSAKSADILKQKGVIMLYKVIVKRVQNAQ